MKLYMHPVSNASRPVRLFMAENNIACEEDDLAASNALPGTIKGVRCADGVISYRADRRLACSNHGGKAD